MVVDKRTVLNENRERVRVRWTAKRGNEIDLTGQLKVAWLLAHSRGSASTVNWSKYFDSNKTVALKKGIHKKYWFLQIFK